MDQMTNAALIATRLTIASILLTTVMVNALPLLPYGQDGIRDFASSSSSSSASSGGDASDSQRSLKEDLAALDGLSRREADILALMLLENEDSHSARPVFNKAFAPSRGNSFEKRADKRFNFGFSGLDNVDHILSTLNERRAKGRGRLPATNDAMYDRLVALMRKSG